MTLETEYQKRGESWAQTLTVPYNLPEPINPLALTGFNGIRTRLAYLFKQREEDISTGLESVPDSNFVKMAYEHDVFYPTRKSEVLLTADWDQMVNTKQINHVSSRGFICALRKELNGHKLIELGAGTKNAEHKLLFKRLFGVKSYSAVDIREEVTYSGGIQSDVLQYLQKQPDKSAIICAFGLMNEPLSPINKNNSWDFLWPASSPEKATRRQWEHEYLRRLAKEIARVTPDNAILFGDGIHPVDRNFSLDYYLQGNGFGHQGSLYAALISSKLMARQPFFMRK